MPIRIERKDVLNMPTKEVRRPKPEALGLRVNVLPERGMKADAS